MIVPKGRRPSKNHSPQVIAEALSSSGSTALPKHDQRQEFVLLRIFAVGTGPYRARKGTRAMVLALMRCAQLGTAVHLKFAAGRYNWWMPLRKKDRRITERRLAA